MPLSLESANIVLLGNFNPYIVSPEWLTEFGIWKARDIHLALGALRQDGVNFLGGGTEWYVSSDQLRIDSLKDNCGEMAVKILEELPHTPVTAVGSNFVFQDETPSMIHPVFDSIRECIHPELKPQLLRWGTLIHKENARVDMTIVTGDQGTTVSINHHRQVTSTEGAKKAASLFLADKRESEILLQQLLGPQGVST